MHINPFRLLITLKLALLTLVLGVSHPLQAAPTEFPAVGPLGFTSRVSVDSNGTEADEGSSEPAISADGRFVVFASDATNLVPDITNDNSNIFVYDRHTGSITRVSVASDGTQANGDSGNPTISGNGQFVAFDSNASNLVANDTNGQTDVFVHNLQTGETTRVSVASGGVQATGGSSLQPSLSFDGQFVAFHSNKTDLVLNDTNNASDVFVHNRTNGNTTRVSVDASGNQAIGFSDSAAISANGQFIAFNSNATNLVPNDTNGVSDIFVRDRQNNTTTRVSVSSTGIQGDGASFSPAISADGRYVAFDSSAINLIDGEPFDPDLPRQIYRHDRDTGLTTRVSLAPNGDPGNANSNSPSISGNGEFIAFNSNATNLIAGVPTTSSQIFLRHIPTEVTVLISVNIAGEQGNQAAFIPSLSLDGRHIAYLSFASNLVPDDLNNTGDIFAFTRAFPVYLPTLQR